VVGTLFAQKYPKIPIFGSLEFLGAFNFKDWFFSKKLISIQIMNALEISAFKKQICIWVLYSLYGTASTFTQVGSQKLAP